ncbi:S46 family peptidase [Rubripirellula sp.]|nr:S46 family peptidase [Rubripirellula sp.]MDB4644820.1 S46 family peptidase [Rubripirellula sp.]
MKLLLTTLLMLFAAVNLAKAEEGMYPISEVGRLGLANKGLRLTSEQIFNADQTCLVDGICKVNGCTGSFVSPRGLIITNHHCAYRAIQSSSTTTNDYLRDGFIAQSMAEEIPAKGYTVRITESFEDISDQVLSAIRPEMTYTERTKAIEQRQKELEKTAEQKHPGQRAEVAEMFAGKTYVLFIYTYIQDVRLVFAPPASVGNYGGEIDNWEWPRHTGDFSFMRAYVAPDGSSAEYAEENVPYQPKRFIQVDPNGVDEGDYVMLIGYPGRTARHKTASFLEYEQHVRLPYVVDLYQWQIEQMQQAGTLDRAIALKLSSRMKGLANVEKRSRGQLKGLVRKNIVGTRTDAEAELQAFINSDDDRRKKHGNLLTEIAAVYTGMRSAQHELDIQSLRSASQLMSFAFTLYDSAVERQKTDLEREMPYMDRNIDLTRRRLMLAVKDYHAPTDRIIASELHRRIRAHGEKTKDIAGLLPAEEELAALYDNTRLGDPEFIQGCLEKTPEQLAALNDPALAAIIKLYPKYLKLREQSKSRAGRLDQLYGNLVTVKQEFLQQNFVPDANATLRLTYGHIKGYSPEDAVYKSPITTLGGAVAKATGVEPFVLPRSIIEKHKARDFGQFMHPKLNDVPTAILYDTDTTGGNSGSPILNGDGKLVGVNFDRAFEATINDFAWNESYSRSIGVDIRYALWITGKVFGANHLLKEMGVQ